MTTIAQKADYVRGRTANDGRHGCHWPGCTMRVPPAMWGCKPHWYRLPPRLRQRIWATFRPGQEITKTPSPEYLAAAKEVQQWIAEHGHEA